MKKNKKERKAKQERKTRETSVVVEIELDGDGLYDVETPVGFFNHMLESFARHSMVNLKVTASGDVQVDYHHTVEDVGIVLGRAISDALGDCSGIQRFGWAIVPMDEVLSTVSLDISGRPYFFSQIEGISLRAGDFPLILLESFFSALCLNSGITMHVESRRGKDAHHIAESIFKSFARAFNQAISLVPGSGIPSTKGTIRDR